MITLTTGIMFLLFTFGRGKFYEGGPLLPKVLETLQYGVSTKEFTLSE
jgi:hypothetical protein